MKKALAVIDAILSVTLYGCSEKKSADPVDLDYAYSCTVEAVCNNLEYTAQISRDENGVWKTRFTAPETISSLTVTSFGESFALEFQGINFSTQTKNVPVGAISSMLTSVLDHAAHSSDAEFEKSGKLTLVKGECDCGEYVLTLTKSGELSKLTIGDSFSADFSQVVKLEPAEK